MYGFLKCTQLSLIAIILTLSFKASAAIVDANDVVRIDYNFEGQPLSPPNTYIRLWMSFGIDDLLDSGEGFDIRAYNSSDIAITNTGRLEVPDFFPSIDSPSIHYILYPGFDDPVGYFLFSNITGSFDLLNNTTLAISTSNGDLEPVAGAITIYPSAVPVPAAVWLFGSGLLGLVGMARKKVA